MTTSLSILQAGQRHAIKCFGSSWPQSMDSVIHASQYIPPLWQPQHELGLFDPIRGLMLCTGRTPSDHGAPCNRQIPIARQAGLEALLEELSRKRPLSVTREDLERLLEAGMCGNHGPREADAKAQGMRALQYRLDHTKSYYERMQRFCEEIGILKNRLRHSQSLDNSQGGVSTNTEAGEQNSQQLLMQIGQLQQANILARMETEKVEADAIDREAKLDRDVQDREDEIAELKEAVAKLKEQIKAEEIRSAEQTKQAESRISQLEVQNTQQVAEIQKTQEELESKKHKKKRMAWLQRLRGHFK